MAPISIATTPCDRYGHEFDDDGYCLRTDCDAEDEDADWDEDDDEDDEEDEDEVLVKTAQVAREWNGRLTMVSEDGLKRAIELVREHGITETTRIIEILEEEMALPKFSPQVSQLVVIAIRETADERAKVLEPEPLTDEEAKS
jgi:hypothetical protein